MFGDPPGRRRDIRRSRAGDPVLLEDHKPWRIDPPSRAGTLLHPAASWPASPVTTEVVNAHSLIPETRAPQPCVGDGTSPSALTWGFAPRSIPSPSTEDGSPGLDDLDGLTAAPLAQHEVAAVQRAAVVVAEPEQRALVTLRRPGATSPVRARPSLPRACARARGPSPRRGGGRGRSPSPPPWGFIRPRFVR